MEMIANVKIISTSVSKSRGSQAKGNKVNIDPKKLLRNKKVIDEIKRHKWLESEIAGYDIGYEKAAEDWLKRYAHSWMAYHFSSKSKKFKKETPKRKTTPKRKITSKRKTTPKRRKKSKK